jgi:putative hydrolase of the HAD superfamily
MALRTLLIDLGNVLLYFSHERMSQQIAQVCQVSAVDLQQILFKQQLQRRFERGEVSEEGFRKVLECQLGRTLDAHALRRAGSDIFALNEPMVPLLDRWKRNGYRLVLLSNTCVTHYEWVREHFDLLDRFDDCILSFRVGSVKPEEAIFRTALKAIECAPNECFYTDDVEEYVSQGRSFGMHAEVFRDAGTLAGQLEKLGIACQD